jgi:hypothetical protein
MAGGMTGMTWEIEFGGAGPEDVLVTSRGLASVESLHAEIGEVMADPRFRPGLSIIFDETGLDWSAMSTADLRRRVALLPEYLAHAGDVRIVIVTGGPVGHGVLRQMDAYAGGFTFEWEAVRTLDEARSWLRGA